MGRGRRDKLYLTAAQRQELEQVSHTGHARAKKILHAQILLMSDESEHAPRRWTDEEISAALGIHRNSVRRIRKQFFEAGLYRVLNRKVRAKPPIAPKVDGAMEAHIIALCCSAPPEGYARWSIRLLTSELKARSIVTEISRETVRRTLKKTSYDLGRNSVSASQSGT